MTTQRATVLIVDDTELNFKILVEFLGDTYDLIWATNGEEALECVAAAPPDIILLDIMMPGMDGYEVCARLKSDEATSDIPIIFITALSDVSSESKGLDLGAIDFITKPFNPGIVKARVRNHIALREAARLKEDVERIMRHDLKSPLTTVISLPRLLLMDDNISEPQKDMLQRIEEAGYTLMAMINLSTTLFRMERGSYELATSEMDLAAVARKVIAGFEETALIRRITLRLLINGRETDAPFPFQGDNLLCHSMLANLVGNALDASPRDETVLMAIASQPGGGARIEIINRGEVPTELQKRFFEKYTTAGKTRGTGLGTYSARLIARAHGGDITMDNKGGRVVVSVVLPA